MTLTKRFHSIPQDMELWQKFYNKYQQEYLRRRLKAVKLLWEGLSAPTVCQMLGCNYTTLRRWLESCVAEMDETRLSPLIKKEALTPTYRALFNLLWVNEKNRPGFLTDDQEAQLKDTILNKKPTDAGFNNNIWTAGLISRYIEKTFGASYRPNSIYDVLQRLGISYQKAHADYAEADPVKQKAFVEGVLKKNREPGGRRKDGGLRRVCRLRPPFAVLWLGKKEHDVQGAGSPGQKTPTAQRAAGR